MNQKCLGKIDKITDTFEEVTAALHQLHESIEADDEDQVNDAMDMFPQPRKLARALEDLGILISGRPWESRRKAKADE